jgi:hypothetical protein
VEVVQALQEDTKNKIMQVLIKHLPPTLRLYYGAYRHGVDSEAVKRTTEETWSEFRFGDGARWGGQLQGEAVRGCSALDDVIIAINTLHNCTTSHPPTCICTATHTCVRSPCMRARACAGERLDPKAWDASWSTPLQVKDACALNMCVESPEVKRARERAAKKARRKSRASQLPDDEDVRPRVRTPDCQKGCCLLWARGSADCGWCTTPAVAHSTLRVRVCTYAHIHVHTYAYIHTHVCCACSARLPGVAAASSSRRVAAAMTPAQTRAR